LQDAMAVLNKKTSSLARKAPVLVEA